MAGAGRARARLGAGGDGISRQPRRGQRRLQARARSHLPAFAPVPCDVFVTEATFALPVFRHPPAGAGDRETAGLGRAVPRAQPRDRLLCARKMPARDRAAAAGGLGSPDLAARRARPALRRVRALGVALGDLRPATTAAKADLVGAIVLAPPGAVADRWARRLADPVVGMASGWMRVRQRAQGARDRAAADDLRPRRLGRTARHARRRRRAGSVGDARAGGGADPRRDRARHRAAARCACRLRGARRRKPRDRLRRRCWSGWCSRPAALAKIALLRRYFATEPDPDRGWGWPRSPASSRSRRPSRA